MHLRKLSLAGGIAVAFSLTAGPALAQVASDKGVKTGAKTAEEVFINSYKTPNYKAPRAQDGHADLQGVWSNNNATPLQRPKGLEGKPYFTNDEVKTMMKIAHELFADGNSDFGDHFGAAYATMKGDRSGRWKSNDGGTGDYSSVWQVGVDWTNRTSLIVDPSDGRLPELTERGKELAKRPNYVENESAFGAAPGKRPSGPEDLGMSVRCITFGVPRVSANYNSYMQIFQTPKTVAIVQEAIHDARIIPLDGSPHPPANVRFINGDSRGHWEGDTLVIDTTNYLPDYVMNNSEKLHVVERIQRTANNYLTWTVTFDDPGEWVKPWTAEIPLRHTDDAMFEYACHEGNYAEQGILAGARAEDAKEVAGKAGLR
jgi:hypothetical protein